ncbi:membrane protein [Actinorhabdospora filicis]|uniref:Membrane protein n=1 Tax=Actinorhabdospora filicis TaxID=1785913 RepID=A0A9W6SRG0_9ACTN|nr:TIGR03943 family protein [Actinorhabdospora filicis]GLZ79391.1 membrane protein [Actinorhabdospora filicis]
MRRATQAVVLLLLGGALLRVGLTDAYLTYVKAGFRPILLAAAVVLLAVAAATVYYEVRERRAACDHGHTHEPRVAWLLVLPVAGLLLVAPTALGAYAATESGTALGAWENMSDYPPLPEGDPAELAVLDYASRAIFDEGRSIGDRRVTLTGFITHGANGEVYLARMILSCCASDARPIKVGLEGAGEWADDTWVRVVGRYSATQTRDAVNNERIPYLAVEGVEGVERPERTYE